jgi:hypothetical protein
VRCNFGPSFIEKHSIVGANAVSELQPLNPEDRKLHEQMITAIKISRLEKAAAMTAAATAATLVPAAVGAT